MPTPAPATTDGPLTAISLKWSMVEEPGLSIRDTFAMLKDLGFDGVELDAPNALPLAELLAARDATGLQIPGVINADHWRLPLTSPDPAVRAQCQQSIRTALDQARDCGADTVLVVPGVVNDTTSYAQAFRLAREGLEAVLPHAEQTGVAIAIENVWNGFLLSPLEAAAFVDHFGSPKLGWYFDVGNVLRYGRPTDWIAILAHRILKVDLKEFSLAKMNDEGLWKGFSVPFGAGDCDWPAVLAALGAVGYSGWGSLEVPGGNRDRLAQIKGEVDAILRP